MRIVIISLLILLPALSSYHAYAGISGPTFSSGPFTLVITAETNNPNLLVLEEKTSGESWYFPDLPVAPIDFEKPNGRYEFIQQECVFLASQRGARFCTIVDTLEITVDDGTRPPDPNDVHRVTRGDFNLDGHLDIAVVAQNTATKLVDDFVLLNNGAGQFSVPDTISSTQLSSARTASAVNGTLRMVDANFDGSLDVFLSDVSGVSNLIVWSEASKAVDYPTSVLNRTNELVEFISQMRSASIEPSYFSDRSTTETFTSSGFVRTRLYFLIPTFAYDSEGLSVLYDIGVQTVYVPVTVNQTRTVLDDDVSLGAFLFFDRLALLNNDNASDDEQAADDILSIIRIILGTELGLPSNISMERYVNVNIIIALICFEYGICEDERENAEITFETLQSCTNPPIGAQTDFTPDLVIHRLDQNFRLTASQRNLARGTTNQERRTFWNQRLTDSRDPLAPLAIEIVDNVFPRGCLANERYLAFARRRGATTDLTRVGFLIIDGHNRLTDREDNENGPFFVSKLGPRQIADYHFEVFNGLGLPNRTFGAALFTGHRNEAALFALIFCPSCDQDVEF